jgi:sucrose-6-phosphate hydrolase SacC (GH32 family)
MNFDFVKSTDMKNYILLVLMSLPIFSYSQTMPSTNFKIELGKVAEKSVFANDSMSIWGGSVVKGDDGLYHMFYSQWPKNIGWEWVNYSVIAHAVSDSPFGPYQHKDITLPDRGTEYWDGSCTHNPTVHKFNGKYYLYYMGNRGDEKIVSVPGKPKINWVHRNNQRIGVAVADSPNGPWQRFDKPVLDITFNDDSAHDALMTSNPSVCQMADGKILMVYKAVGKKFPLPGGGPVVHMVAIADNPTGPFTKYPDPVFLEEGVRFPAEDPYIWYQEEKYRAIVKYIHHDGNNREFSLVHYDSVDGIDWEKAKNFMISDRKVEWENGRIQQFTHLERPQVLIENGKPVALLCAADTLDANNVRQSFNIQIPLKITKE